MNPWIKIKLQIKLRKLNKIKYVNSGGCAIVAFGLQEWLNNNYKLNSEIVYMFLPHQDFNQKKLPKKENINCAHAVIKIDDNYYDSKGKHSKQDLIDDGMDKMLILPAIQVFKSINYKNHWNHCFDRTNGIKQVNKILNTNIQIAS